VSEKYIHRVYGMASAVVRNPDGTLRDATPKELEDLRKRTEPALRRSLSKLDEDQKP
jgi:hypothetical protein